MPKPAAVAATSQAVARPIDTFKQELTLYRPQVAPLLPPTVPYERFQAAVIAAVGSNPDLLNCTRASLMKACMEAAELDLSLNPALKECDILTVWNGKAQCKIAQLRPRYGGLLKLARRSGEIKKVYAHEVRAGDEFEYALGLEKKLVHKPATKRGALTHSYCVWEFKDGTTDFEVLDEERIERAKKASQSRNREGNLVGPWVTDEAEMWRKTAVRAASKYIPMSAQEFHQAVALDEARDIGREATIDHGEVIVEAEDVTEITGQPTATEPTPVKKPTKLDKFAATQQQAAPAAIPLPQKDGKPDWDAWYVALCNAVKAATTAEVVRAIQKANGENIGVYGTSYQDGYDDLMTFFQERIEAAEK